MSKYFIYARKSTDSEDRQVLSIEAQMHELREFAAKENLEIVKEFTESKTAKAPGRLVFNEMLKELEAGHADGIISWSPDRLSRNSSDSGRIIYFLDTGVIKSLKFPIFWFENSSQGKFNLSIAFSQSKYMIDNLSDNVKRGIRQKIRRGEYPGPAPLGYINNLKDKTIEVNPETFNIVKTFLEKFANGEISQSAIIREVYKAGIKTKTGRTLSFNTIKRMLMNPFYYGTFRLKGELHSASHPAMISKETFDKIQEHLKTNPRLVDWTKIKKDEKNFLFPALGKCGECDYSITQEWHKKKSGRVFKYYRCSKRSKTYKCKQKAINEKDLAPQIENYISEIAIDDNRYNWCLQEIQSWRDEEASSTKSQVEKLNHELEVNKIRLEKLLDLQLEGDISPDEYRDKKTKLINIKVNLEESKNKILLGESRWFELMQDFLKTANQAHLSIANNDFREMHKILKKVSLNQKLTTQKLSLSFLNPFNFIREIHSETESCSSPKQTSLIKTSQRKPESGDSCAMHSCHAVCEPLAASVARRPQGAEPWDGSETDSENAKWRG